MSIQPLRHFDVMSAKQAYADGRNVTEFLRAQHGLSENTPDIIEIAYDLQAGSYVANVLQNPQHTTLYEDEVAGILDEHIQSGDTLLDIGTGELTTLSFILRALKRRPERVYAFDISWSRLHKGLAFAQKTLGAYAEHLMPFVADISEIPLRDKSVNITTSSHALEPNGGKLKQLMQELFRVTRDKLILFEPCYEINSEEGRQRMDRLGYIRNLDGVVRELGGEVLHTLPIRNISKPLNPTACFIVTPPASAESLAPQESNVLSVPGTDLPLLDLGDVYHSPHAGLCYPIVRSIPVLKSKNAILATALND